MSWLHATARPPAWEGAGVGGPVQESYLLGISDPGHAGVQNRMPADLPATRRKRSLKELVTGVRQDAGLLVRQEIALAKAELKEKATGVAKKAAMFSAAALLAYAGVLVVFAALVLGVIALGVTAWLAALIVGAVVLLGAFGIVQRARR
jgi:hypothetical protein